VAICVLCSSEFEGTEAICPKCAEARTGTLVPREQPPAASPPPAAEGSPSMAFSPSLEIQAGVTRLPPTPRSLAHTPIPAVRSREGDLPPGAILLHQFRVMRKLGEGGFGAVYLAEQLGLDRKAVIKVVHPALVEDETFVQRFHREARMLASLDHHHLVKVFNFGQLPTGMLFLAMEYGGDRTLAQELTERSRFDTRRALHVMSQVLDALFEAHQMGIVHRDLKPANILLGVRGGEEWVKVVDVGIAKVMAGDEEGAADERLTGTGMVLGTPSYYSPEQARGLPVDGRSDLYAAGIVLYEMLTGHLPIKGKTPIDYVRAHAVEAPTPAKKYGVTLPEGVEKIVLRALQKDPDKRYATAREMKAAVDAALRALPKRAGELRVPWRPILLAAAGILLALGLAAALKLGALDAIARWTAPRPKPPARPPAAAPAETAAPTPPPPAAPVIKPGKLLVRAPGAEVRITGAHAAGSDIEIAAKSGAFTVVDDADGWSVAVKYRRAGAGLSLTVESTPLAMVYFEDSPLGRIGAIKVGGAPVQLVFRRPTGGEFALIVKYAP